MADINEKQLSRIIEKIKKGLNDNELKRLDLYAEDYCPSKMDWDKFKANYIHKLGSRNEFMVDYSDVVYGYSWTNVLLDSITLKGGNVLFDLETVMGNNDEDPCGSMGCSKNETLEDLLNHCDKQMLQDAMKSVEYYLNTLIKLQKEINKK